MNSHHAVLYRVSDTEQFDISAFFAGKEYSEYRYPTLGIDEARKLVQEAHRRPQGESGEQTLIFITNFITEEAQQALLKIVEEPPASTKLVFVLPKDLVLLPTLLSRLQQEIVNTEEGSNPVFDAFLSARLSKRMKQIEEGGKDKEWMTAIKRGLVNYTGVNRSKLSSAQLLSLEYVASHLLTRGASNKFLLEHAALVLPA